MTNRRITGTLVAVAVLGACSDGPGAGPVDPARRLCDGSDGVRLAFQVGGGGQVEAGQQVMFDNGAWFLFVDGQCRFYVRPPNDRWADVHTGSLDAVEEQALATELSYDAWPRLAGAYQSDVAINDGSVPRFHDGASQVLCGAGGCQGSAVPDELQGIDRRANDWVDRLWMAGTPVANDLRVVVVELDPGEMLLGPPASWPLAIPVADLAISATAASLLGLGAGTLISDGPDVALLRALREEYRSGVHGAFWYQYVPFEDAGGASPGYRAYVRDTIPLENSMGIVEAPPLP